MLCIDDDNHLSCALSIFIIESAHFQLLHVFSERSTRIICAIRGLVVQFSPISTHDSEFLQSGVPRLTPVGCSVRSTCIYVLLIMSCWLNGVRRNPASRVLPVSYHSILCMSVLLS